MPDARVSTGMVAVTRAAEDAEALCEALRSDGLEPLVTPLLAFSFASDAALADRLRQGDPYDWLVCTSRHAVEALARALVEVGSVADCSIASARVAAVGPATAQALRGLQLTADVVPQEADAAHLAQALLDAGAKVDDRILFPKARAARAELPTALRAHGVSVDEVVAYDTIPSATGARRLTEALLSGDVAVVTLASGSAARAFASLVPPEARHRARVVSIGPTTTAAARSCALAVAGEASEASLAALSRAAHRLVHETLTHA